VWGPRRALLVLCLMLCAPWARAESREVVLHATGAEREARALAGVVRELLNRVSVGMHLVRTRALSERDVASPSARARRALAAVWVDLQRAAHVRLYVYAPAQDRVLVRTIDRDDASDEIVREEVAHIVHTAVEGLLAGAPVGLPRREVLPVVEPVSQRQQPRKARARSAVRLWQARVGYRGALVAPDVAAHGPGAELAITPFDLALRPGFLVSAHYAWPIRGSTPSAGADLQSSELRVLATLQHALAERWLLRAGLGAGFDSVSVKPFSERAEVQAADGRRLTLAALRAALELEVRVTQRLSFFAAITLDGYPGDTRYVLARKTGDDDVLSPWRLRPGLELGLAWP
jgi:hypothetical protein